MEEELDKSQKEPCERQLANGMSLRKRKPVVEKVSQVKRVFNQIESKTVKFEQFIAEYWVERGVRQEDQQELDSHLADFQSLHSVKADYEHVLDRIKCKKKFKVNWSMKETDLLVLFARLVARRHNLKVSQLAAQHWRTIAEVMPGRTEDDCFFRIQALRKTKVRQNPWLQEEQFLLRDYVKDAETCDWVQAAKHIFRHAKSEDKVYRTGKQCRQHYYCHLDPSLKKGVWSKNEDKKLMRLYNQLGRKWFQMTKVLVGRNQNAIKNRFTILCRTNQIQESLSLQKIRESRKSIKQLEIEDDCESFLVLKRRKKEKKVVRPKTERQRAKPEICSIGELVNQEAVPGQQQAELAQGQQKAEPRQASRRMMELQLIEKALKQEEKGQNEALANLILGLSNVSINLNQDLEFKVSDCSILDLHQRLLSCYNVESFLKADSMS